MSDDEGSDVDTGLRMRDLRANAKALLRSVGVQSNSAMGVKAVSGASMNTFIYVQLSVSVTADVESKASTALLEDVKKRVSLSIYRSPNLPQQSVQQDTSVSSEISDTLPEEERQKNRIELLMEENDLVKRLYHVFETNGATLVDVRSGLIVFKLQIKSRNRLKSFWNAIGDGTLQLQLRDILITKDLERQAGCSLFLQLHMNEKEYAQGLEYFGKEEMRLVLVGRTGTGKSSTGNHILLKEKRKKSERPFATSRAGSSMTEKCSFDSNEVLGRDVVVVDTPGLFDTSRKNMEVLSEITRFLVFTHPGPHAIILVMRAGTVTIEVRQTVELLVQLLKEGVYGYMVVLFTGKDKMEEMEMTLQDYLETLPLQLRVIISKCGDRCMAFNNKASSDENKAQVGALLQMVEEVVQKNGGNYYESDLYRELETLFPKSDQTSDWETFREAAKNEKPESGGWFWQAVTTVATVLGWDYLKY